MPDDSPPFSLVRARDLLRAGDVAGLRDQLDREPWLATARWPGAGPHYEGYFHRPTLLHHLSGNPLVVPLPQNAPELATLLLERGAEVDAVTEPGPSQPTDIGWTPLGLVATSLAARQAGVQDALVDLFVAKGADVDARNGGALVGALYYGEAAGAHRLVERGADVDFVAAAGLGRLDLLERFVRAGGELAPDAHHLVHYSQVALPERETRADILALALCGAAQHGRLVIAERLLELGAAVNARPPHDHAATALHWAVIGDEPESIRWLLANGADPSLCDTSYDSTPLGWAQHMRRAACIAAFG